nr:MAG TPA: hypothetical protein [Caudoviricetes sp.]
MFFHIHVLLGTISDILLSLSDNKNHTTTFWIRQDLFGHFFKIIFRYDLIFCP